MLLLNNFESQVPEKILSRGFDYFNDEAVNDLAETEKGVWQAVVSGSGDYDVSVELQDNEVLEWDCNCPYDDGPICKHVVAVLYAIRKEIPARKKQKKKAVGTKMSFEDILLQTTIEELRDFLRDKKKEDKGFGEQFMLYFADKDPKMDIENKYRQMVKQLVRRHSDRGFMDYRNGYAFAKAMMPVSEAAATALSRNNFRDALTITGVICSELMEVIQQSDDSAGAISDVLFSGIGMFRDMAQSRNIAPEMLEKMLSWIEKNLQDKNWFGFGDFGYDLLDVAEGIALRVDPNRMLSLLDQLEAKTEKSKYSDYERESILKRKVSILQKAGRAVEAEKLFVQNLHIVDLRKTAVDNAVQQKNFAGAKKLIAEGIKIAEGNRHPGTVHQWEEMLLQIAKMENDLPTFRFLAQKFAFDRGINIPYYRLWKDSFSSDEWPAVLDRQIEAIKAEESIRARKFTIINLEDALFLRLAPVYVEESEWEKLHQLIPPNPNLNQLSVVHPHLAARYPEELLAFYLSVLRNSAIKASNRGDYQQLAALMKKVKQDIEGSHAAIDELAASLIKEYPRRPAMVDELGRVLRKK